jgi:serine/threonine-protein kinase
VSEAAIAPSTIAADVPQAVDAIVLHALQKDRGSRYQTADEFREDLEAALAGRRISNAALGSVAAGALVAGALATEALNTVPPTTATTTLPPAVPEADMLPDAGDEEKPNRTGLWILLCLLAAALIALAVLVLPGMLGGDKPPPVTKVSVPDLTSLTLDQATGVLTAKGLKLGTRETAASNDVPEGKVISQNPDSGALVNPATAVDIVLSTGPDAVEVPKLEGLTKSQATSALKEVGLKLGQVTQVESTEQDKGHIVSSNPSAGDSVAKDTAVAVEIASGKVTVPNVRGQTVSEATTTLTNANLKVDATQYEESTQPEGTVISQTNAGKTVDQGTTIKLVIAKAPATPTSTPTSTPTETPTSTP